MQTLVIGGSRGIGWELAKLYAAAGDMVIVTGRKAPDEPSATIAFRELDLSPADWSTKLSALLKDTGQVDRLVYAPGYYQEGTVTDLSKAEILDMIQVCGIGFIFAVRDILLAQSELKECVLITSSSQWTARKLEPVYNFTKAGVAHFAHALSLDERIGKMLVAGPTGTKTAFHAGRGVDMSTYHEPDWMAQQIYDQAAGSYEYKFIKILRDPASVEVADLRQ